MQSASSSTRNGTRVQLVGTSISFSATQRPSNTKSDVAVMPLRTAMSRSSLLTFGISTVMLTASLRLSDSRPLRHRESVEGPISVGCTIDSEVNATKETQEAKTDEV